MSANRPRERSYSVNVDGYDRIEVSSIDSFPASDPPGWIETKARPCEDAPVERDTEEHVRPRSKRACL